MFVYGTGKYANFSCRRTRSFGTRVQDKGFTCFPFPLPGCPAEREGRRSKDVGAITGMTNVSVNSWLSRYKAEGIGGLSTREGRGRKPKIDKAADGTAVLEAVKSNRQRLQTAKAEWGAASGKTVSRTTFRRFLKRLADVSNG